MTVYHLHNFKNNFELYCRAAQLIAELDYEHAIPTYHFSERSTERAVNLKKISSAKVARSEVFEIKVEQDKILSVGIRVSYCKKKNVYLIIGFADEMPKIVTAWFDKSNA